MFVWFARSIFSEFLSNEIVFGSIQKYATPKSPGIAQNASLPASNCWYTDNMTWELSKWCTPVICMCEHQFYIHIELGRSRLTVGWKTWPKRTWRNSVTVTALVMVRFREFWWWTVLLHCVSYSHGIWRTWCQQAQGTSYKPRVEKEISTILVRLPDIVGCTVNRHPSKSFWSTDILGTNPSVQVGICLKLRGRRWCSVFAMWSSCIFQATQKTAQIGQNNLTI